MDPREESSESCSGGPLPKRKKFNALEKPDTADTEPEEASGVQSDGDDDSLFDFEAG